MMASKCIAHSWNENVHQNIIFLCNFSEIPNVYVACQSALKEGLVPLNASRLFQTTERAPIEMSQSCQSSVVMRFGTSPNQGRSVLAVLGIPHCVKCFSKPEEAEFEHSERAVNVSWAHGTRHSASVSSLPPLQWEPTMAAWPLRCSLHTVRCRKWLTGKDQSRRVRVNTPIPLGVNSTTSSFYRLTAVSFAAARRTHCPHMRRWTSSQEASVMEKAAQMVGMGRGRGGCRNDGVCEILERVNMHNISLAEGSLSLYFFLFGWKTFLLSISYSAPFFWSFEMLL